MTGGDDGKSNNKKWDDAEVATLKRQEEHYRAKLAELRQSRPRGSDSKEELLVNEITRLEAELTGIKDDLSAAKNSYRDAKEQAKHARNKLEELQAKVDKVQNIVDESEARVQELSRVIAKAVDRIFADFCKKIGCPNIRVYEDIQNSQNQAQGEEILRTTKARDTYRNRSVQCMDSS